MAETTALTWRRYKEGDHSPPAWREQIFQSSWSHKCPTYVLRTPPCQGSCPSGHDIRGWFDIIRGIEKPPEGMSWQEYAFRRMVNVNPFPAVMGRVCPAPCEDGCNRNEVEDHLSINAIEHYIGDWAIENGLALEKPEKETGKKVAVIGGGPAGLSAAYQLRRRGHTVVVFDDHAELGGMMRYGIPGYRTPRHILDAEIQRILDTGVETRMNTRVGVDVSLEVLEKEFDAIFWGMGTHSGRLLPGVPGCDAPNVITGVDFLRAYNEGRLQFVPKRVVVVGGGDTSIDVASVARRLGHITKVHDKDRVENVIWNNAAHDTADIAAREGCDVTLTSLFPVDQMIASPREVEDATREGVHIKGGVMPLEVLKGSDGRAWGLKMCECTMEGMTPKPVEGTEFTLELDILVVAIGQKGNFEGIEDLDNGKGFIDADGNYRVKGKPDQFVGGDIVRPHLLTTAIGQGYTAADSIDLYLNGKELPSRRPKFNKPHFNILEELHRRSLEPEPYKPEPVRGTDAAQFAVHNYEDRASHEVIPADELFLGHFTHHPRNKRQEIHIGADEVIGNFEERLRTLAEEQVKDEAQRCMSCGLCFECDNCVIFCPQEAVQRVPAKQRAVGRYVYTEYTRCIGCHICHDVCPTGYIQMGLGE